MAVITFQPEFRPALPCVISAKDYREYRANLIEMDRIFSISGMENRFIARPLAAREERDDKRLKYEKVYPEIYANGHALYRGLEGYFDYYNHERQRSALDKRTPAEVFMEGVDRT